MKTRILGLFLLSFALVANLSFGQDTTVVQSFTYKSLTRDTLVEFPDQGPSYEKILMRYNMRCHGGTVSSSGNNNGPNQGGCGEWDYSCNTYITDSSRVDSLLSYTPDFSISGVSASSFEYADYPTFSYTQATQKEVSVTSSTPNSKQIVSGTDQNNTFLPTNDVSGRTQMLFTSTELLSGGLTAGDINSLVLQVQNTGAEARFFKVRIKETTETELDASNMDLDGFTEVYYRNTNFVNAANNIVFYQPFTWTGTGNLLVDISFTNSTPDAELIFLGDATSTTLTASANTNYFAEFNGQRLDLDTAGMSSISDEITIMAWVYGDENILPANTYFLEATDSAGNRQINVHLPWSNGQVYWDCGGEGSSYDRINKQANAEDYEGKWNHWAFTKNATKGWMRIYLNGELWHTAKNLYETIDIANFTVGHSVNGTGVYYGKIDELSIWNKELGPVEIQQTMSTGVLNDHPKYTALVNYFKFNEGNGLSVSDETLNAASGSFDVAPKWSFSRGHLTTRGFQNIDFRPDIQFDQGVYVNDVQDTAVLDSTENAMHTVIEYGITPNYGGMEDDEITELSNNNYWPAGSFDIIDEDGATVGSKSFSATGTVNVGELTYYRRYPMKFEIMSFVTPYGNGLDLGVDGKSYWFDVTDFYPILNGNKRISIEKSGRWQEEMDVSFYFIEGTPIRDVINIQQIWRDASNGYANINSGRVLEDRQITLDPSASMYKIRSSITGHGQEGEFIAREHFLNINGGDKEFTWDVWKECGHNPVYPQGGTWVYDRAGWCPGMATDVFEAPLEGIASPGETITIDYGLETASGDSRYITNHQLVTYGPYNHTLDAAIIDVQRPSTRVEYERINPACNLPIVVIQNTGENTLTSLKITYGVKGGTAKTYTWNGSLETLETEEVMLPVDNASFWSTNSSERIFEVSISEPNESTDEYANNNQYTSAYEDFPMHDGNMAFEYKTNNNAYENKMKLTDYSGNVIFERTSHSANTTYEDKLQLAPGCYRLEFTDSGNDGLSWWANSAQGSGYFRLLEDETVIKTFGADFGAVFYYEFYTDGSLDLDENEQSRYVGISPNPTSGLVNIQTSGEQGIEIQCEIINVNGQKIMSQTWTQQNGLQNNQIDLSNYNSGVYIVKLRYADQVSTHRIVKQ